MKPVLWVLDRWSRNKVSAYDALGCPVVGRDPSADFWLRAQVGEVQSLISSQAALVDVTGRDVGPPTNTFLAYWANHDFDRTHSGMPVLALATNRDGLAATLPWPSIDFLVTQDARRGMPDPLMAQVALDHDSDEMIDLAANLKGHPRSTCVLAAAKRWLRFWGLRGFGFTAIEDVVPASAQLH